MNIELALNKFVESSIKHKIKEDDEVPCEKEQSIIRLMKILRKKGNSYKKISEVVSKSTRKKFSQSWVFNILKRENKIPPNEAIIRHNICNVELQSSICF